MNIQILYQQLYSSPALESLKYARALYSQYGAKLKENERIDRLLEELNNKTHGLSMQMGSMEMGEICTACASRDTGGCCSRYMADECDVLQILMNLLAGVAVSAMHDSKTDCFFLGSTGCVFLFKPMFCLNYNCSGIKEAAGKDEIEKLEKVAGSQLTAQYKLEQELLRFLKEQTRSTG